MTQYNQTITRCLSYLIVIIALILPVKNSFAINDGVRNVDWEDNRCKAENLFFNPFDPENKDIAWEVTNPVCGAYFASAGTTLAAAEYLSSSACGYVENIAVVSAQMAVLVVLSPMTVVRRIQETNRCVFLSHTFPTCCFTTLQSTIAMGVATGQLATIYSTAEGAYENARICGHDWNTWTKIDDNGDETSDNSEKRWKRGAYDDSYQRCLENLFTPEKTDSCYGINFNATNKEQSIKNKYFREYIYGGKEFEDDGDNQCNNPTSWSDETRETKLGYKSDKQRYYMTGSGNASNYACYRFLTSDATDTAARKAYDCCVKRSQNTLCIESRKSFDNGNIQGDYEHKFCESGARCNVGGVWYDVYGSQKKLNYLCAKTYSVCPYNHPLGGGTESSEYDAKGNLDNYCQVMNHCAKIPVKPYVSSSSLEGAFISQACRDLRGDTQNFYQYQSDLFGKKRNFSAPMAQCFKETMENLFLNKAGYTECSNPTESPDANGVCASGNYKYQEGVELSTPSFFVTLQDNFQSTIKIALTFSIMLLGFSVMLGMSALNKKQLMTYILKISLVMYFAVGEGWQSGFLNGVLGTSSFLSEMMFNIDESSDESKLDGCQFPRFNYADDNPTTMYDNPSYPEGKEYLRIWDTLDCKLARAIGYGPNASVPNFIKMLIGGFMAGSAGILFLVGSLLFAFFLFSIIIRALHIFILSIISIVVLLYISPLTITLSMFAKTKSIFDGWWKQILGYILQPVILFAYLGLLITFFDKVVIGDATFSGGNGTTAAKEIVCTSKAQNTSIYCIFRISELKNYTGLEIIGIGLPILKNINSTKVHTIINSAFLMFILLVFLDKITGLAKTLVGGNEIKNSWKASVMGMTKSSYDVLHGFQKRRDRATSKLLKGAYNRAKNSIRNRGTIDRK
jgi:type IV secretory pathway VirB6-like protein